VEFIRIISSQHKYQFIIVISDNIKLTIDMKRNTTYIVDPLSMCRERWFTYPF